jgi:hypothetical protein
LTGDANHHSDLKEFYIMAVTNLAVSTEPTMDAMRASARVNRFLLSQAGTNFAAGDPVLNAAKAEWRIPILMITPGLVVGQVGEAVVAQDTLEIISHTAIEQIHAAAMTLRERHKDEIEAAFLRARKI